MIRKLVMTLLIGAICLLAVTSVLAAKYNEAPMLRTRVAAGELPPVEERLPEHPKVVKVLNEIGKYGGTIRLLDMGWLVDTCFANLEPLIEGDPTFSDNLVPSLIERVDASPDATTFTFHMRKGLKWSDGVPVTTEDVLFKWNDVLLNKKLTPVFPPDLKIGMEKATLEVMDKYTFKIKFPSSYGAFLSWVSYHYRNYTEFMLPKHYMKQFHIKYTPLEKLEPLIKEAGYEKGEWWKLFNRKAAGLIPWDPNADIGVPVLSPWMVEKKIGAKIRTLVRNPYYWKIDEKGNQLPYIDRIYSELFTEPQIILSKTIAGEADLVPEMVKFSDLPMVKQYEKKAGYKIMIFQNWMGTWVDYFPNYTYNEDLVWRKIIRDVRFRQALSLAIDRKNICDTIFLGFAKPVQVGLLPNSKYMEPWMFESYAEYDPERANRILDEMGLKRGPDGIRLRPDGKKLTLPIEFFEVNPYGVPVTEMVVKYWRDIGIDATMKVILASLWFQMNGANKTIMSVWHACEATDKEFRSRPWHHVPVSVTGFGPLWNKWYITGGKEGEEPPPKVKDLFRWRDIMKLSPDPQEILKAGKAICRSQAENLWRIGVGSAPVVCIIKENLGNMPSKSPDFSTLTMSTAYNLEQAFWKK